MKEEKFKRKIRRAAAAAAALLLAVSITFPAGTDMSVPRFSNAIVASAETIASGTCGTNLTWTLDDNGTLTISGTGAMTNWSSNSSVPWYSYRESITSVVIQSGVTSIGKCAFEDDYTRLTSITIPNSVTSIKYCAFDGCTSLTSVTIPNSVTSIGNYAFDGCTNLGSVIFEDASNLKTIGQCVFRDCTSLTSITIPDSVTQILDYTFEGCTSLTSVLFEDNSQLTSISEETFRDCTNLTSITIPDSVTTIESNAFLGCTSLTSINIPAGVTTIESYAFLGCTSLTSIDVASGNSFYCSVDGVLFNKNGTKLIAYPANKSGASYVIPDSVTSIEMGAFMFCTSLTSINIPAGVTSIGYGGSWVFNGCTSLESINVASGNTYYCSDDGILFNNDKTALIAYPNGKGASYVIPDSVTSIGYGAFMYCTSLTSITIPAGVQYIYDSAFEECTSLTSVLFENNSQLTSIGWDAFYKCESLTSITIPASVQYIYDSAFEECTSLTSVLFENNSQLASIGDYVFYGCESLSSIFLPESIMYFYIPESTTPVLYTVADDKVMITMIVLGTGQTSVDIPETIGGYPVVFVEEEYRQYVGRHTHVYDEGICTLCGEEYVEDHDNSGEWLYDETYHWKVCAAEDCDEILDKAEHDFDEGVITTEPTEDAIGVKTYTCQTCGYQTTEPVSKLEHTHKESTDYNSDENGHWHYCTVCGEVLDYAVHVSDGGKVTKAATTYCEGEITYSCTVCGRVLKTEIIPMKIDPIVMGAFANSYIYSYDSDMNKITVNRTRKPGTITVDLGREYAGKSFVIYEGRNSTKVKVTEGVLDANGKAAISVEDGNNYTLVIE